MSDPKDFISVADWSAKSLWEILDRAPRLIAIGCFCIGTNQVDLGFANAHGVPVFNAPFSNTRSVAELVIAEIIMLMRGIPAKNAATKI